MHFLRNVLGRIPKGSAEMVLAAIRTIFAQPDALAVSEQLDEIVDKLEPRFPVAAAMLAEAKADVTPLVGSRSATGARSGVPTRWSGSTRRSSGGPMWSGSSPTRRPSPALAGAVLLEIHDEWAIAERRYLSEGSIARLDPAGDDERTKEVERAKTVLLAS